MSQTNEFPKLSRKEFKILELLIAKGEMFGLEMVEASEGELPRGTIYVTLQRMGDKGYVESREEPRTMPEIGIPRRKYLITEFGKEIFYRLKNIVSDELLNLEEVSQLLHVSIENISLWIEANEIPYVFANEDEIIVNRRDVLSDETKLVFITTGFDMYIEHYDDMKLATASF